MLDEQSDIVAGSKIASSLQKEIEEVLQLAHRFKEEVVLPNFSQYDLHVFKDLDWLPEEFLKRAAAFGLFTLWLPKIFGGKGYSPQTMALFNEEIASVCLGMANIIAVHYLGITIVSVTSNFKLLNTICQEVVRAEKLGGFPCLVSVAATEPDAGTDVEELELIDRGTLICKAIKKEGGYLLSGTKSFISNGHFSTWHIVTAYADLKRPSQTPVLLAVKKGTMGFSLGKIERKMGQKVCPTGELIFDNCFVKDEHLCLDLSALKMAKGAREVNAILLNDILSLSRVGVGAFGAGMARGAYQCALDYAKKEYLGKERAIDVEWVQSILASMLQNFLGAKSAYFQAMRLNAKVGPFASMQNPIVYRLLKWLPSSLQQRVLLPILSTSSVMARALSDRIKKADPFYCHQTSLWASHAKTLGADLAVKNCQLAIELMGKIGLRHDAKIEKLLRDAKLLQIYEGPNQINRLNLFYSSMKMAGEKVKEYDS